ncbi:MAG: DUF805 domain-containing protein [Xanthobacteraceae bacterium]|jgi:uncharacterized membrane protein YhaH (DUF805 family)
MSMTQLLFSFQGRLNRKPYWMTMIATMVIIIILLLFALILIREHRFEFAGLTLALLVILYIPLIWINLAIGAKRLHDRDKSAWWLLLFYAAPGILSTASNQMEDVGFIILHIISFAISVWAFVELGCLRGTPGANRYGPDLLGTSG